MAFADFINNETLLGEVGSPRGRAEEQLKPDDLAAQSLTVGWREW